MTHSPHGLGSADDTAAHVFPHTYHQPSGRELSGGVAVVTARGKSFRFESRYRCSLVRLWDLTIRDRFPGDRKTVVEQRQLFMGTVLELITRARAHRGHVEVANDLFFCNDRTPERMLAQRLMGLKYEVRLPVERGRAIAAGSFNIHGNTFGSAFEIRPPDGTAAQTARVGLGLERLTYAFLCQHGLEPRTGPPLSVKVLEPRWHRP